jgi:hypothetical protein
MTGGCVSFTFCNQNLTRRLTIDTTHLLCDHDSRSTVVASSDSRHAEAVEQTGKVTLSASELQLFAVDDIRVVVVSCGDDLVRAQFIHGIESLRDLSMFHEPTRRLGTEEDADGEDEGRNECRSELEAPCDGTGILDNNVGAEAEEDT